MKLAQALRIKTGEVVAFVGGGGKTTAMFRLAAELARDSRRVLLTTSTRIFAAQIKRASAHLTFDPTWQILSDILPRLEAALDRHSQVLLIGQADPDSGKAFGVSPETVDTLAATGRFEVILNEADGSRMRPFKAPAAHEPVIPASTTLVVPVVGVDILGQPLSDETVHRAELVSQLSGLALGQPITPETIVAVLTHPQGGLKNVPNQARVVPLLNKVESETNLRTARHIAAALLKTAAIDSVAIGAVQKDITPISEVWGRPALVILAAGGSSRFGSPKQLAQWQGQTFLERAVKTALAVQEAHSVTVVLGAAVEQCRPLLENYPVKIVFNERWAEGQSTSMQAGLAALPPNSGSVLFLLVDLPRITPELISTLIHCHRATLAPIVWPEFAGKRGNPVLFDQALFPELLKISGDTGGRPLLKAYQAEAERVAVDTPAILQDVDRPEDLEQAQTS
jgi:molybdenum cofactor cytidylyltransferase